MTLRARIGVTTAVLAAAVALAGALTLPPRPLQTADPTTAPPSSRTAAVVAGALHVHTNRSDGAGTIEDVAAAAAAAGLQFVVLTDHGDGTGRRAAPAYRDGVLCLDGLEISTDQGHYLAIGVDEAPYPLAGDAADVVEDVARLGGFGIVAHPDSPKGELAWSEWDAPFPAMEWINGDAEWRNERVLDLARTILHYPVRPSETLAALLDRPAATLARWDGLAARRPVVALAGTDAHAHIGVRPSAATSVLTIMKAPSYRAAFGALSVRVELDEPWTGNAREDAGRLLDGLRAGRVYTAIDALALPRAFEFEAERAGRRTPMGGEVVGAGPVRLRARAALPGGARMQLLRNGQVVHEPDGPVLDYDAAAEPAVYRVEVRLERAPGTPPIPWILSNPIYVGRREPPPAAPRAPAGERRALFDSATAEGWAVEHGPTSRAAVDSLPSRTGRELAFRYALGTGSPPAHAALARNMPGGLEDFDRIAFTARADRPMRLMVQLRAPGAADRRWGRSVYLDTEPRAVMVRFDELRRVGGPLGAPPLGDVADLLFVVDTVRTEAGRSGVVWFAEIAVER